MIGPQLIERGVPVWDLLSKRVGVSAAQLQKMASQGKLGREAIRALIEEMGKASAGAATQQMQTWAGMVSNLADHWMRFQKLVMQSGLFEFLKTNLKNVLDRLERMAQTGELQAWAQKTGEAIKTGFIEGFKGLMSLVEGIKALAESVGGFGNLIKITGAVIAAAIAGPIVASLAMLTTALIGLSTAILTTPVGWIIAGLALIGVAAAKLIDDWQPFFDFFKNQWNNIVSIIKRAGDFIGLLANPLGSMKRLFSSFFDTGVATINQKANTHVGGKIKIEIDQQGRARVADIKSDNPSVALETDIGVGPLMAMP